MASPTTLATALVSASTTTTTTTSPSTTLSTTTTTFLATNTTITATVTTIASNTTTLLTTLLANATTAVTNTSTTIAPTNTSTTYEKCLVDNPVSTCRLAESIRVLAYLLLAVSLIPQILHLFRFGSKYIAGISYSWIVLRVLAFAGLMFGHKFNWSTPFEFVAFASAAVIFLQIVYFAENLHRQQRLTLIVVTLVTWIVGGVLILVLKNRVTFLVPLSYMVLAIHMLPQILLNSLLRTTKAISKFSIMALALSNALLFASYYTYAPTFTYLVATYYAVSFFLFLYLQSVLYVDENIHIISRSAHTVLTPGVDVFTGIDSNGTGGSGQEPQMFSIDDLESPDGTDVVYQPMTSNKSNESEPLKGFIRYATLGSIFVIEMISTMMLIYRAWTAWVIFVPISIPAIIGLFFFLRTRLDVIQTDTLRKIL